MVAMYSVGTESLIKQARDIGEVELQKFYSRITKQLTAREHSHDVIDSLQRLHLILAGCKEDLSALSSLLLRSLEGRAAESPSPTQTLGLTHCLPIVNTVITYSPDSLTEDHVIFLSKKLVEWLRYASLQQGMSSSGGFFASPRIRQPGTVAELDGCVCGDFFTVLCVSPSFSEDQWMNLYSFSLLRHWLITYHNGTDGNTSTDTEDRSEVDGSVVSMVSATSSSSRVLPPKERLREKSLEYCQRLVEQSDRKALKRADTELQKACLVEAVCILDSVCLGDPGFVYRAFPCVKALFGRLSSDLSYSRVLLPIAQFYLNHGETAAVDSECVWRCVWGVLPAECFNQPFLAHEMLTFIRANQLLLKTSVPLYSRYFPNLLKFLAWDSPSLVSDYLDVLPSLVTTGTALELLHSLLDLPCLTAALTLQLRYVSDCLIIMIQIFSLGDTIDRLSVLHDLLMEAADWPRVVQSAQSVPVLLHVYFNTITTVTHTHAHFCSHNHHPSLVVDQSRELLEFAGITANVHSKEELYTHVVWVLGEYLSVSSDPRCSVDLVTSCFEALEAVLFEVTSSGCPSPRVVTSLLSTLAKLASRSHDLIPRVSLFLSKLRSGAISWCHSEEDVVAIVTRGEELWSLLKLPSVALSVLTPPLVVTTPSWHGDTNTALPPRLRSLTSLTHTPLKHN
uniref:Adaptor related protein complex 5 subunit zeta 1 n=1 Tax=Esox lucius TaxID=8010 RepID=A0AAY5LBI1_ESOLU